VPFPSVSRDDPAFDSKGGYWRGGVWLPLAYMSIKALERYGFHDLADTAAETLVRHMCQTWREFEPHTIWEAYSPTEAKPSTHKRPDQMARPDFCGWSALGPISLLIENVLGLQCDAGTQTARWRIRHSGRHGVRNLRFGQVTATLIYDGHGGIEVETQHPFQLQVNGKLFTAEAGRSCLPQVRLP
jgi:glycogen debranching enzyme